jgi:hypothetical protein
VTPMLVADEVLGQWEIGIGLKLRFPGVDVDLGVIKQGSSEIREEFLRATGVGTAKPRWGLGGRPAVSSRACIGLPRSSESGLTLLSA